MNDEQLIRLVDGVEEKADSYITLEDVQQVVGAVVLPAIAAGILLVDQRTRLDGSPVTVCRLNRHHPLVAKLTGW